MLKSFRKRSRKGGLRRIADPPQTPPTEDSSERLSERMCMMQGTVARGKPIEITDADFDQQVLGAAEPVVVDFWAPWCPPCRVIAPILAELADEYAGKLTIAKVNIDEQQRSITRFGIQGAPTLVIFKDGKEVDRLVGARRKSNYQAHFDAVL